MSQPRLKCLRPRLDQRTPNPLWRSDSARGSRHQRGYGWTWEQLRERVLERDCGLCQPCLKRSIVTLATQVDHITPKAEGGTDDQANLQAICEPCHETKTRAEMQRARGGG